MLVLGGARSGKSERAELRLAGEPEVTYVATPEEGDDPEWAARVTAHRARRPTWWRTARPPTWPACAAARGALLIDGIGTWLAAVLDDCGAWDPGAGRDELAGRVAGLAGVWRRAAPTSSRPGRDRAGRGARDGRRAEFRDELGRLNQALAAESEEAELSWPTGPAAGTW